MLSYENVKTCLKLVVNSISPQNLVHCHHAQFADTGYEMVWFLI